MSRTTTTGFQRVNNGQQTNIDLTVASLYLSGRVRWRGVNSGYDKYTWYSKVASIQGSGAETLGYPAATPGTTFDHYQFQATATVQNNDTVSRTVRFSFNPGFSSGDTFDVIIAPGASATYTRSFTSYAEGAPAATVTVAPVDGLDSAKVSSIISITLTTVSYTTEWIVTYTENPKLTVAGQTVQHTGVLADGEVTPWYSLPAALSAPQNHPAYHYISGSGIADVEIELAFQPRQAAPTLNSPAAGASTYDRTPTFDLTLGTVTDNDDASLHAVVKVSPNSDLSGAAVYRSKDSQTGWEYYDGTSWVAFPTGGVAKGSRVRFTPQANIPATGSLYWSGAAQDDWAEGYLAAARALTITLLPAPARVSPVNEYETHNSKVPFMLDLPAETAGGQVAAYHAKIRLSTVPGMVSPEVYSSAESQTGWEIYDPTTATWSPMPSGGAAPGKRVRYTPQLNLQVGIWYWDACAIGPWGEAAIASPSWMVDIKLSTLGPYLLTIAGTEWIADPLEVTETANGQIGQITMRVGYEQVGKNFIQGDRDAAWNAIHYRDEVVLVVRDALGNQEIFKGRVTAKNPQPDGLEIIASTGEHILASRTCKQAYSKQDLGAILKHAVTNYCAPLDGSLISTSLGIQAEFPDVAAPPAKSVLWLFEEARRLYYIRFWVDAEWRVRVEREEQLSEDTSTLIKVGS